MKREGDSWRTRALFALMPCGLHYQELFERGWTAERINEAIAAMETLTESERSVRSG